jgi:hypothetical protein
MLVLVQKMQVRISVHRETIGLMLTNLRVGDRVEDKETHKRGYVTFVYSELEFKGEVIAVLFDGRDEPATSKSSTPATCSTMLTPGSSLVGPFVLGARLAPNPVAKKAQSKSLQGRPRTLPLCC